MKLLAIAALLPSALAVPQNPPTQPCPALYPLQRCCSVDIAGIVDLDCRTRECFPYWCGKGQEC